MDRTLDGLRELAGRTASYGWHRGRQKSGEFWDSSLLEEGAFDAVVEMLRHVRSRFSGTPLSIDLGSAGGLVVFLMHHCGFRSHGIEIVPERSQVSLRLRDELKLADQVGLTQGDWTEEEAYRRMDLEIEEIDLFYIYPSIGGAEKAFELVGEKGKCGAVLAANSAAGEHRNPVPDILRFDRSFLCPVGQISIYLKGDQPAENLIRRFGEAVPWLHQLPDELLDELDYSEFLLPSGRLGEKREELERRFDAHAMTYRVDAGRRPRQGKRHLCAALEPASIDADGLEAIRSAEREFRSAGVRFVLYARPLCLRALFQPTVSYPSADLSNGPSA